MKFVSERYAFATDDGRVVLRASVDNPLNFDCSGFEYLSAYSSAVSEFVSSVLFVKAIDVYNRSKGSAQRFTPLFYSYKCNVTYCDDFYLSCALIATLSQGTGLISQAFDSMVLAGDQILPPKQICRDCRKRKLLLDTDGFPAVAELISGKLQLQRVGKKSLIKQ